MKERQPVKKIENTMKTYRIEVRDTYTHMVDIDAESEDKAKDIACDIVDIPDESAVFSMEREVYLEGEI
jgi:hypothetical protein